MLRRFSTNFAVLNIILDGLIIFGCIHLAVFIRPYLNNFLFIDIIETPIEIPKILYFIFPGLWIILLFSFSLYDGKKNIKAFDEFTKLAFISLLSGISMAGILFLSYREISRVLFMSFFTISLAFLITWRIIYRIISKYINFDHNKKYLIIKPLSNEKEIHGSTNFTGQLNNAIILRVDITKLNNEIGNNQKMISIVSEIISIDPSDIVIALPRKEEKILQNIVASLEKEPITIWIALDFYELALNYAGIQMLGGIPMINLREPALSEYQQMAKRVFDVITTFLLLIVSFPLMIILGFAVLILDGKPVIFEQSRVGENGKLFSIYKFRTMKNVKKEKIGKEQNKFRVTKLGGVLRRYSLDELPQFINVLKGEMSLVGPRPEIPEYADKYPPEQRSRLSVPPGITGWWQVNGRSNLPLHLNFEHDLFYVRNYSIWLDLKILWQTIWVVIFGKGAY